MATTTEIRPLPTQAEYEAAGQALSHAHDLVEGVMLAIDYGEYDPTDVLEKFSRGVALPAPSAADIADAFAFVEELAMWRSELGSIHERASEGLCVLSDMRLEARREQGGGDA